MGILLSNPYQYLDIFLLIFVRVMSMFIAVPIFSNRNIPMIAKISLGIFISIIIINVVDVSTTVSSSYPLLYIITVLKEVFIGWLIGFSAYLVFTAVILAGQFIDQQIGFAMVNIFDPLSQIQLSITGNLYYYLILLIMIVTNRHHLFIRAIVKCYDYIPIGVVNIGDELYQVILGFYTDLFKLALIIAAPFFLAMLVLNVVLGILARTAPQMNLFVIGFPLKLIFGLIVLYITMDVFAFVSDVLLERAELIVNDIIKALGNP